ncbi:hypothetical protein [Micromonospora sp. NPDC047738]|uniref:hypothetical protein n=1 Tax=unclassified Micromonospora TaxID=2617518 RepID=UPI0033D227F4
MTDLEDDMSQASLLSPAARQSIAALVLVRYFGFNQDPKFSPWFEQHREALSQALADGSRFHRQAITGTAISTEEIRPVRSLVERALGASDPEGLPFETEIVDHLVLAAEVLDYLSAPQDLERLERVFEHAEELAEAGEEMATSESMAEEGEGVDLLQLESETRRSDLNEMREAQDLASFDPSPLLLRSQDFSRKYAEVIANGYSDEEAGRP